MDLRIGIFGYGTMGGRHAKTLKEFDRPPVAIYDYDAKKLNIAKEHGYPIYDNTNEFFDNSDVVIIATPAEYHYNNAYISLLNGKHVLVEKPLCDHFDNAQQLKTQAEKRNLVLGVDHPERHNPIINAIYDEMGGNRENITNIITERYGSTIPTSEHVLKDGIILDIGPHDIDNILQFVGRMPEYVQATGKYNGNLVQYAAHVRMLFENGAEANSYFDWTAGARVRKTHITTKNTYYSIDLTVQSAEIVTEQKFDKPPSFEEFTERNRSATKKIDLPIDQTSQPLYHLHNDFIRAVENPDEFKPKVTADDAINTLKVIDACVQSIRNENSLVKF